MKISYKQRLFISLFVLFGLFTGAVIFFEYAKTKKYRTEALEKKLDAYASIVYKSILVNNTDSIYLDQQLLDLLPKNLRVSIIDNEGNVQADNVAGLIDDNHSQREEILEALKKGTGSEIRKSASNAQEYLYYAKQYPRFYIRVALPYDRQIQNTLEVDNIFIYFIIIIFLFFVSLAYLMATRFGKSIKQLRDFAISPAKDILNQVEPQFSSDELGEVAQHLYANYKELTLSRQRIALEKEKLLQHIHSSNEGICFFTPQREVAFYNGLFIYHLNTIIEDKNGNPKIIFTDENFAMINNYINQKEGDNFFESEMNIQGKHFSIRVNRFEDSSFEVILIDITKQVRTRLLKHEMTSNIAHELRTPITSIRGYLETINESSLDLEQIKYFTQKAYNQTLNLNELIEDMSIITKIDEAPDKFTSERIILKEVIDQVELNLQQSLKENEIQIQSEVKDTCILLGNKSLLYSVFRNLIENSIRHGGKGCTIYINCYNEDSEYYYFSYYDNGAGIEDNKHLNRLFERFYRVSEGRTRKTGGTGLGLSIVKNAILVHKGTITAKRRKDGKLEFLFKLKIGKLQAGND